MEQELEEYPNSYFVDILKMYSFFINIKFYRSILLINVKNMFIKQDKFLEVQLQGTFIVMDYKIFNLHKNMILYGFNGFYLIYLIKMQSIF